MLSRIILNCRVLIQIWPTGGNPCTKYSARCAKIFIFISLIEDLVGLKLKTPWLGLFHLEGNDWNVRFAALQIQSFHFSLSLWVYVLLPLCFFYIYLCFRKRVLICKIIYIIRSALSNVLALLGVFGKWNVFRCYSICVIGLKIMVTCFYHFSYLFNRVHFGVGRLYL